jgi:SAM-dependent methyltransferase
VYDGDLAREKNWIVGDFGQIYYMDLRKKPRINRYPILRSIASYILPRMMFLKPGSGGTYSSMYCYSVWNRHLYYLLSNKFFNHPSEIRNIAELGPGDSLGIGMAAMYTGADIYYALDVIEHANFTRNLIINNELCSYFKSQMEVPHGRGFERTSPKLNDYRYMDILLEYKLEYFDMRRKVISQALRSVNQSNGKIQYIVPWYSQTYDQLDGKLDLIISQAVMEHIESVEEAYKLMYRWLRKGGVISHQIDFKAHEMTKEWNGHWFINDFTWRFLMHGRKYPMNRFPISTHLRLIREAGFVIDHILPIVNENPFHGQDPKMNGIEFSSEDMITSGALIQAVKL